MNRQALKNFTILSLLLMLTAVSVSAQSMRSRVSIPFSFNVGGETLPAGDYTVEPHWSASNVWALRSSEANKTTLFLTIAVWTADPQEETQFVFNKYGDRYFLARIWTAGRNTGRELSMPRVERELGKNTIERETVALTVAVAARH